MHGMHVGEHRGKPGFLLVKWAHVMWSQVSGGPVKEANRSRLAAGTCAWSHTSKQRAWHRCRG